MDTDDVKEMTEIVGADLRKQVEFLRAELALATESERRLWRAFAVAKGAAEYAMGVIDGWRAAAETITNDAMDVAGSYLADEIGKAEMLSGCAVES